MLIDLINVHVRVHCPACETYTTTLLCLHHNNKDQTAEEPFCNEHNELLKSAQEWVKETAQSCSTVVVLVATVVFAAAYAIPGGNDQSGRPVFQDDALFLLFTCMDVVAIACSLSSVAFFLSVLSSPLEYPLFINNIPRKVMIDFVLLFLSMATTICSPLPPPFYS
ncbi:ankyrin repeat-containing protein NPR4-like [Pyrus communis]|uniref:ankyrin repeat-containing protein NPR4-like n=1 Tax=Pyrus communis TaxID=23211 RepID=UPI0035C1F092